MGPALAQPPEVAPGAREEAGGSKGGREAQEGHMDRRGVACAPCRAHEVIIGRAAASTHAREGP